MGKSFEDKAAALKMARDLSEDAREYGDSYRQMSNYVKSNEGVKKNAPKDVVRKAVEREFGKKTADHGVENDERLNIYKTSLKNFRNAGVKKTLNRSRVFNSKD